MCHVVSNSEQTFKLQRHGASSFMKDTSPALKRYSLKDNVKCQQTKWQLQACASGRVKLCWTPSLRMRAFLSLTLPKEPGKLVPNCRMASLSVIPMARGILTACQIISKVITLVYYTCLARFEWGSLGPLKVSLPVFCTCTDFGSKEKQQTKPYFRSLFKSQAIKPRQSTQTPKHTTKVINLRFGLTPCGWSTPPSGFCDLCEVPRLVSTLAI